MMKKGFEDSRVVVATLFAICLASAAILQGLQAQATVLTACYVPDVGVVYRVLAAFAAESVQIVVYSRTVVCVPLKVSIGGNPRAGAWATGWAPALGTCFVVMVHGVGVSSPRSGAA